MQTIQAKKVCACTDIDEIKVLDSTADICPTLADCHGSLHAALFLCSELQSIAIEDYSPTDFQRRYEYNQSLAVPWKCILHTYSGSKNHIHFMWKIPDDQTETELLQRSVTIQQELKECFPSYHTQNQLSCERLTGILLMMLVQQVRWKKHK